MTIALIGGVQLSDRTPDQDASRTSPARGARSPATARLPLAEVTAAIARAHPELPIGIEVLSDEIDALGLDAGTRRLAASLDALLPD